VDGHEGVVQEDEAGLFGTKRGNYGLDFGIAAYPHGDRLDPKRPGGSRERIQVILSAAGCRVGIEHDPGTSDAGRDLLEETEPLATHGGLGVCEPGDVAAWARQSGDETGAHWVANDRKHNRDGTGRSVQCCRHRRGRAEDNVGLRSDQLRREITRPLDIRICPLLLDPHVASVDPT
jgi:hypothetical protein